MQHRKLIIEPGDGCLLAMDGLGNVRSFQTPKQVLAFVKRIDRAAARIGHSTTTTIEWRDMPADFEPPA
jgi:hypothetical protein